MLLVLVTSPGNAVQLSGANSGVNSKRYVPFETAVQLSSTFVVRICGVSKVGLGVTKPLTLTTTEFGVLLNCMVTWFDG